MSQLNLLLQVYLRPLMAFSGVLDYGRLLFAVAVAATAVLTLQIPRAAEYERERAGKTERAVADSVAKMAASMEARAREKGAKGATPAEMERAREEYADDLYGMMAQGAPAPPSVVDAMGRFTGRDPTQYFSPLLALGICFVPIVILVLTRWDNLGGFTTILFRDYVPLLVCCLLAWTAPYLLLAGVNEGLRIWRLPWYDHAALWWAAQAYFAVLAVLAIRTVSGTRIWRALVAAGAGWCASVGGVFVFSMMGGATAYLASPFVLYYLYYMYAGLGPEFRSLGAGLRTRQRLKQGLENATLNPRDADAHYQLGLIYV